MTSILGISAYYHDSSAALVVDGQIVAAAQEERFLREKNYAGFPHNAIAFCLSHSGLSLEDIDHLVFYEDPYTKFHRLLTSFHFTAPFGLSSFLAAMPNWLTEKVWLESVMATEMNWRKAIHFCDHHVSHGASAFFPSPFEDAAILTVDGVGEWSTTTMGLGRANKIELTDHIRFPHSLGLLYSSFTSYLGFRINNGEYKVMGLAPYGSPIYEKKIRDELIHLNEDGSFLINQEYFNYTVALTMFNSRFEKLFGHKSRKPESELKQFHADVASSLQAVLNEAVLGLARRAKAKTSSKNIVMAGGVALNCVANGLLAQKDIFQNIWIQPAAGDAGGALGCALWFWHQVLGNSRDSTGQDKMCHSVLGPNIADSSERDDKTLREMGAIWEEHEEDVLARRVAEIIKEGRVVAVAKGPLEWGPRALGNRSIFADARNENMLETLNAKVKKREAFRPFAPMVLEEEASLWFSVLDKSPYMLFVHHVAPDKRHERKDGVVGDLSAIDEIRSQIPAVTHVDYTSRLQTVGKERPFAQMVLTHFQEMTGCPAMVNTSFNRRGEPIVCTAADAFKTFASTDIDCLVVGNRILDRKNQMFQLLKQESSAPATDNDYLNGLNLRRRTKQIDRTAIFGLVIFTVSTIACGIPAIFSLAGNVTFWTIGTCLSIVMWLMFLFVPALFIPIVDVISYIPSKIAETMLKAILTLLYFTTVCPIGLVARYRRDNLFDRWTNEEPLSSWETKTREEQKLAYSPKTKPTSMIGSVCKPIYFFVQKREFFALPVLFILLLIGLLFFFIENSAVAPLIYPIF